MANFVSITQKAFFTALTTGELTIKSKDANGNIVTTSESIFDENGALTDTVKAYAQEQITKIEDKNSKRAKTLTKAQKANAGLADVIFETMEAGVTYTSADVVGFGIEGVATVQKVTALMKGLVTAGKVEVAEVKKDGSKGKVKGYIAIKSTEVETEDEVTESEDEVVETETEDGVTE